MPLRSNRICSMINCNKVTPGNQSRCNEHTPKSWDIKREYNPFYSSARWKKTTKLFLSLYPICCKCERLAKHTDHIIRIVDGGDPYDFKNLQPLCIRCHSSKTAKEIRSNGTAI